MAGCKGTVEPQDENFLAFIEGSPYFRDGVPVSGEGSGLGVVPVN